MDSLFTDPSLSADLAAAYRAEQTLVQQLAASVGGPVRVYVSGLAEVEGTLVGVGRDHVRVGDTHGVWMFPIEQVDGFSGRAEVLTHVEQLHLSAEIALSGLNSALRELAEGSREISVFVGKRWFAGPATVGADFVRIGEVTVPLARLRACRAWY